MKKSILALMLCFVSIFSFGAFSAFYCFGTYYSEGECVAKSFDFEKFRSVEWSLLSDAENIVLNMDNGQSMMFKINKKNVDSNTGVTTFYVTEMQSGMEMKLYYYLNEPATKYLKENGRDVLVYEMDINRYVDRMTISVLFMPIED